MLKGSANITACQCIHMTTENDINNAQTILEGRCVECGKRLPDHQATCVHSPHYTLSDKLKHIALHIDTVMTELEGKVEENQEMLEEINDLIIKLKQRKGKDNV